jgi:transposase
MSIRYKCRMIRLSDEQWERIPKHFPEEHVPDGRGGRKPIPTRRVLEAVLWILNTGARWHMLPQSYPNYETVHRRFQTWCSNEVLRRVLTDVANELRDKGVLDEEQSFIDAPFAMAKGGGSEIGPTKRGKGMKNIAIVDRHGLPLSVSTHAANHHEMIAPHRSNRRKCATQDGRRLRRYARRWLVERFFAWIQWQRRILVRWEFLYPKNFLGLVQFACLSSSSSDFDIGSSHDCGSLRRVYATSPQRSNLVSRFGGSTSTRCRARLERYTGALLSEPAAARQLRPSSE